MSASPADTATKYVGGGNEVKATKNTDGSYTLAKLAPTTSNAYAALLVQGAEGQQLADLGEFCFTVDGHLGGGSPRMNLFYDNDGDGGWDGYALVGGAGAADANGRICVDLATLSPFGGQAPGADATLVSLSVLVDEQGTSTISDITLG